MQIHFNIEKFLSKRLIESDRLEFKRGWNPNAIYRSICAFANDFDNIGGGYILIGVEEENGIAKRPVAGLNAEEIDKIQREMIGFNNLIKPYYAPKLHIEEVDGKPIIILWVPRGNSRPYEVPENIQAKDKRYYYYIRRYSNTVNPSIEERQELINLANQIPFDDRANTAATLNDISMILVRDHLIKAKSKLADTVETADRKEIFHALDLLSGPDELLFPKNIALLMFCFNPEKFFPRSHIEWVEFPKGVENIAFFERPKITGSIQQQVEQALSYFKTYLLKEKITKISGQAEALRVWNYPYIAIEEAIVNAVYHKNYQVREPIEIRILPDKIEIINYGGPDRSVKMEDIKKGIIRSRRYRNSRIGDFFKEIDLCEAKGTGIPTIIQQMKNNNSPLPIFETDDDRTFFITTLPINELFLNDEQGEVIENDTLNDPVKDTVKDTAKDTVNLTISKNQKKLLEVISENNNITADELVEIVGINLRNIKNNISKLKQKGLLIRIGPDKGGYWQVNS